MLLRALAPAVAVLAAPQPPAAERQPGRPRAAAIHRGASRRGLCVATAARRHSRDDEDDDVDVIEVVVAADSPPALGLASPGVVDATAADADAPEGAAAQTFTEGALGAW